jgi:cation:H+ antiporter
LNIAVAIWFVLGLAALVAGAEILVRGASGLARALGVSSLIVGLTVVSFGTSAPELSITLLSILRGQADLSVGNVIGSNIANILLILGFSALVAPLVVRTQLVRVDVPIMIFCSFLVLFLAHDGTLGLLEGIVLIGALMAYTTILIRHVKKTGKVKWKASSGPLESENRPTKTLSRVVMIVAGLILLVYGARWLVEAATAIAQGLGVSELVIGLTVVAGGTSLPELATSVVAAFRGERDIAIGNVVGSCIMNLLLVLGAASLVAPDGIAINPAVLSFDLPIMIAASLACLPILFTDHLIARWEGALFLSYYIAYTLYLILRATQHDSLPFFNAIMVVYVMPLTLTTLVVLSYRASRRQSNYQRGSNDV